MDNKDLGTYLHGISSTEDLDSAGERIKIDGIDISSLPLDGLFNWEHKDQTSSQIIGKVLYSKKILKESDCDNEHHKYFWKKAGEKPYLYVLGVLFDKFNHSGAMDVAAMLRFDKAIDTSETKQTIGFSIEGSKLDKKGNIITKCIARKVTVTNLPCNKVCIAELLEDPEDVKSISKESFFDIFKKAEKMETDLRKNEKTYKVASKKKKKLSKFYSSNVQKALTASCGTGGAPSARTGMSALSKEYMKKTMKKISNESFNRMGKKEELIKFLTYKMPKLSKKEILAIAKTVAYVREKKLEKALKGLSNPDKPYKQTLFTGKKPVVSGGSKIKPKRTFSSKETPENLKIGDRIKYDAKKPKTGKKIYSDPKTFKSDKEKKNKLLKKKNNE